MPYGKYKMGQMDPNQGEPGPRKGGPKPPSKPVYQDGKKKPNPKSMKPGKPGRIGIDDWRKINKPKKRG